MAAKHKAAGRVIFVNRFFYPDHSATSQMLSDLAFALAKEGFDITVVTSRLRYDDAKAKLPARETIDGVNVRRIWTTSFGRGNLLLRAFDYLTFYLSVLFVLLRMCRKSDVVVAKTDPPMLGVVVAAVCALRGSKLINWLQDVFPEVAAELGMMKKGGLAFRVLKRLRDWSLRRAGSNVVLGKRMAEYVQSCGIDEAAISIIPNWADGEAIKPIAREDNPLREEWGLGDKFVVGYSGNLGRAHDWESIFHCALRHRTDDRVMFLIVGGGAGFDAMNAAVKREGLANVLFHAYQPRSRLGAVLTLPDVHITSLHPKLDAAVFPSKFYGVLAAGRAFIHLGGDRSEICERAACDECGWISRFGDGPGLAAIIEEIIARRSELQRRGIAARVSFERDCTLAIAAVRWQKCITQSLRLGWQSSAEPKGIAS